MKQLMKTLLELIFVIVLIILAVLLIFKIRKDTLEQKSIYEEEQYIEIESEYLTELATDTLSTIKNNIEKDVGMSVELADTGSVSQIDIYFVVKVDNEYRYIVKKTENNVSKFEIANTSDEEGKYILSPEALGFDECIYTNVNDYVIDSNGKINYIK